MDQEKVIQRHRNMTISNIHTTETDEEVEVHYLVPTKISRSILRKKCSTYYGDDMS